MSGRTLIVGDLHGCFDELQEILNEFALADADRVVSVGDLVSKGEKSREVLELFMTDARFSSVAGNHDRAVLRGLRGDDSRKLKPAQRKCVQELEDDAERYANFLESLPLALDLGEHLVVHAGVRPGVPMDEQDEDDLLELRTLGADRTSRKGTPWYEVYDGEKTVIFGHWPAPSPRIGRRAKGLDTGCVYGYKLTGYVVEEDRFISVQARRQYSAPARAS